MQLLIMRVITDKIKQRVLNNRIITKITENESHLVETFEITHAESHLVSI